jgi:hypothetical protein
VLSSAIGGPKGGCYIAPRKIISLLKILYNLRVIRAYKLFISGLVKGDDNLVISVAPVNISLNKIITWVLFIANNKTLLSSNKAGRLFTNAPFILLILYIPVLSS